MRDLFSTSRLYQYAVSVLMLLALRLVVFVVQQLMEAFKREGAKAKALAVGIALGKTTGFLVCIVVAGVFVGIIGQLQAGTHCIVAKDVYAAQTPELKQELYDAQKIKDYLGIALLQKQKKVFYIPAGTAGLVLDTDVDINASFWLRRKVRILSAGDAFGEAVWIDNDFLKARRQLVVGQRVTLKDG
jgi:hypothetical protein